MGMLNKIIDCKQLVETLMKLPNVYQERILKDNLITLRLHLGDSRLTYYIHKLENSETNIQLFTFQYRFRNNKKLTFDEYVKLYNLLLEMEELVKRKQ